MIRFEPPLQRARLIRRYKRFLADIVLADGREVTAHCANPGAMLGLAEPGMDIWVQPSTNPKRKLQWSWILVELDGDRMAGIDTSLPNRIVGQALREGALPSLAGYDVVRPEQRYGENSRIDFLLQAAALPDAYVEVKNVHLNRQPGLAEFPDCVTARGAKHLIELSAVVAAGHRAIMLYLVQMTGCDRFSIAGDLDPKYAAEFKAARAAGVEVTVIDCEISPDAVALGREIPLVG